MSAINEITKEQQTQLSELRKRFFLQAVSTQPADRIRAENAARRLAEIGGVKVNEIVFVSEPSVANELLDSAYASLGDSLRASLRDSLRASLGDSLRASLRDSLRASLWDSLRDSLRVSIWESLRASLRDSFGDSLRVSIWDSLWDSLRDSLGDSLRVSIWDSLRDSLSDSLGDSLWDSLGDSLGDSLDSLWDSIWDTGWLAFYVAGRDVLSVKYNAHVDELLRLYEEIAASCFAIWLAPGRTILCERPERVEIDKDGNLIGLEWTKGCKR